MLVVVVCFANTFVHFMMINVVFEDMCLSHFAYAKDLSCVCAEGSFGDRLAHTAHHTLCDTLSFLRMVDSPRFPFMSNVVNAREGPGGGKEKRGKVIIT